MIFSMETKHLSILLYILYTGFCCLPVLLLLLFNMGDFPAVGLWRQASPTTFHHNHGNGEVLASLLNKQIILYKRLRVLEYVYVMVGLMY